jgi:hypothetical protein
MACTIGLSLHSPFARATDLSGPAPSADWRSTGVQDEPVVIAARFAMVEQNRQTEAGLKLLTIKHARKQEGSGMQYSMNLMVRIEGKRRLAIAVVWVRPDGSMELTRWHWV